MEKNIVGKSKIELSAISMGCWSYGGGKYWGSQSQQDVNEVVAYALENNVNYFDTAEVYNDGESERSLGKALKGKRDKAIIGTKISTSNILQNNLKKHCEESLKRLNTDYIDIYMLHWPINQKSIEHFAGGVALELPNVKEVFFTLEELKKEGKIREIGLSNHGIMQMKEVLKAGVDIAVNELPYNLISRAIEKEILPFCIKESIGVLGYMAFQQGILTGIHKGFDELRPSQLHSRHFKQSRGEAESRHFEDGAEDEILSLLCGLEHISDELGVPISTVSLAFAMQKNGISSTIVGSRNIEELKKNIAAIDFLLPDDARRYLETLSKPIWDLLGDSPDYYENRKESRIY